MFNFFFHGQIDRKQKYFELVVKCVAPGTRMKVFDTLKICNDEEKLIPHIKQVMKQFSSFSNRISFEIKCVTN